MELRQIKHIHQNYNFLGIIEWPDQLLPLYKFHGRDM